MSRVVAHGLDEAGDPQAGADDESGELGHPKGPIATVQQQIVDTRIAAGQMIAGGRGYLRISFAASEENIVRGIVAIADELAM